MKFKIDENLPVEIAALLRQVGHEAMTVLEERLEGAADFHIASICHREERVMVTLDTDFADIRVYPPEEYSGIVVLRLRRQDKPHVLGVSLVLCQCFPEKLLKVISGLLKRIGLESEVRRHYDYC
jgi:predicted nuclease of predicted toxin-antitoxin system